MRTFVEATLRTAEAAKQMASASATSRLSLAMSEPVTIEISSGSNSDSDATVLPANLLMHGHGNWVPKTPPYNPPPPRWPPRREVEIVNQVADAGTQDLNLVSRGPTANEDQTPTHSPTSLVASEDAVPPMWLRAQPSSLQRPDPAEPAGSRDSEAGEGTTKTVSGTSTDTQLAKAKVTGMPPVVGSVSAMIKAAAAETAPVDARRSARPIQREQREIIIPVNRPKRPPRTDTMDTPVSTVTTTTVTTATGASSSSSSMPPSAMAAPPRPPERRPGLGPKHKRPPKRLPPELASFLLARRDENKRNWRRSRGQRHGQRQTQRGPVHLQIL